ncbi:Ubiquilin-3, partial [Apophysomyces sp. BC1034]
MSNPITVKIRPSSGVVFNVEFDPESTSVLQLKEKISESLDGQQATQMRLVYSGRILNDDDLCSSYAIRQGHTVHVVRSTTAKTTNTAAKSPITTTADNTTTTSPASFTNTATTTATTSPAQRAQTAMPITPDPVSLLRGISSEMSGSDLPSMDPESMRRVMESPLMQNLLSDTGKEESNPQMRALVEQNPEVGHVINDPAFLRQSIELMRNPELMREMQRSNDRALSNIEALPGGFNYLRRMYSTFQDPVDSATRPVDSASDEANERLARALNVTSVPENQLNTQALPNPWAQQNATESTNNTTTPSTRGADPFAGYLLGYPSKR